MTHDPDRPAAELELVTTVDRELPPFEGLIPVGVLTSLTGSGQRIGRAIHHGDRVVMVVEASVADIAHPMTKDGLKRRQTLTVVDLYEVEGVFGRRLLASCRQAWSEADRGGTILGTVPLPDMDANTGRTDESGTVLTPAELDAIGLGNAALDPVVVVWSDETRETWPDDFDDKIVRPHAGDYSEPIDGPPMTYIRTILDAATAETIEEWTPAQEEARLLDWEEKAAAEEAAAMPIAGYGDMSATEALLTIKATTDTDVLKALTAYEEAHKARRSVLGAIDKRIAKLTEEAGQ